MAGGFLRMASRAKKPITQAVVRAVTRAVRSNKYKYSTKRRHRRTALNRWMPGFSSVSPFPQRRLYKLQYTQRTSLNSAGALLATYGTQQKWSLNSLFDPDITGTGHQPYGYDALQVAYGAYKVVGVTVEFFITDPTTDGMRFGWQINNPRNFSEDLTGVDPDVHAERQMSGFYDINDSGSQKKRIKFFIPMYKAGGLSKLQFNADLDTFCALVTASPTNQPTLLIAAANIRGANESSSIMVTTKLTYHAILYERKIMAQS